MKRLLLFAAVLLMLLAAVPALGQAVTPCPPVLDCLPEMPCPPQPICPPVIPPPQPRGVFTNPDWLKITYHRVSMAVENQIAVTEVDMAFVNEGEGLAEGTFVFPLPEGAAVDQLTMYINGQPIDAKILPAAEARRIYNEIVRQYRDPALLEYVGRSAIQANVFPIPPGETRRIQIRYSSIVEVENGLIHVVYPLKVTNLLTRRPIESLSLSLTVAGSDPISSIYSPSHNIAITRSDDGRGFRAGFESGFSVPNDDFSLYYGIAAETINLSLLTYRDSATEDGFFMLLVQPPLSLPQDQIVPKDVIIVLDQSGSMEGPKWDQARAAAEYVLRHLNSGDRFNVVLFSTGWRVFSTQMETPAQAEGAIDWVRSQRAEGGTDINGALMTALRLADRERPVTVLFLTDGLATEGETDTRRILSNLKTAARPNARIFTFGVGDDVDTLLLDSIVRDFRGAGSYVRPSQRVDEEVAALYNKIGAPVLTDVSLDFGSLAIQDLYPRQPLPDLFAGTQLTLVGRYRGDAANLSLTLRGKVNGVEQAFVYNGLNFPARAGGEPFIPRLWATRRIGDLLNTIRLNGENPELVDAIVKLSVRYGIITPYTSFLIEEDDILTAQGRERAARSFADEARALSSNFTGAAAVDAAQAAGSLAAAEAPAAAPMQPQPTMDAMEMGLGGGPGDDAERGGGDVISQQPNPIVTVKGKTFIWQNGVWTDTTFTPDTMQTEKVVFLSDAYFALLEARPELGEYFALGERVIVVLDGTAYEVTLE